MKKFNTLLTYVSSNRIWLITLGCLDLFFAFLAWVAYPGDFLSLVGLMIFVSLAAFVIPFVISIHKRSKIDAAFRRFLLEPDDTNEYLLCESAPASMRPYIHELAHHLRMQEGYVNEQQLKVANYESYIENWVHEIKKPLSLMTLLLDNRKVCVQRAGRLAAAPPESFHAGGLWLHPHLCSSGSGPAAHGGLAEMPQRKPEVTQRTAAGIPYELTRKKVKRLNLHIRRDGTVAVSIPWSYTVGFADAFVTEQAQWIREAVSRQLRRNARDDQPLPSQAEALACFTAMSDKVYPAFAGVLGGQKPTIKVRDMTSRWGVCCMKRRQITFALQLYNMPPAAQIYVVVHEYCHFLQPNHSPAFWAEVEKLLPDWKERRALLK